MNIKITIKCSCGAFFDIKQGSRHPETIICPNCGESLPHNASQDLIEALNALSILDSKMEETNYSFSITEDAKGQSSDITE